MHPIASRAAVSASAVLIAACTTATPINAGDGIKRYLIDCGRQGASQCIAKANEVCPAGYQIDDQSSRMGIQVGGIGGGTFTQTTMRVTCK